MYSMKFSDVSNVIENNWILEQFFLQISIRIM